MRIPVAAKMGLLVLSLLAIAPSRAQDQADEYYDPAEMAAARERLMHHHGDSLNYLLLAERLEGRLDGERGAVWEAQGWIGRDISKFWLKTEGEREEGETSEAELQLLYSHAVAPYWDLQAGLRRDFQPGPSQNHLVIGLQGLAPGWFEIDAAAFVSEEGKAGARFEAEYDLRLGQRLILQPRLELNLAFSADEERGIGRGLHASELGLRLRYEIRREIAPYLGLAWRRAFGETEDLQRARGLDAGEFTVLAGFRFWY